MEFKANPYAVPTGTIDSPSFWTPSTVDLKSPKGLGPIAPTGTWVKAGDFKPGVEYSTTPDGSMGYATPDGYNTGAVPTSTGSSDGFQWGGKGGAIDLGAQGLGALAGGLQAYTGWKGLQLAEDQFDFNKALAQANFGNQAQLVNDSIQNSGEVGMSLAGNTMTDADRAARQAQLDAKKVKTTI